MWPGSQVKKAGDVKDDLCVQVAELQTKLEALEAAAEAGREEVGLATVEKSVGLEDILEGHVAAGLCDTGGGEDQLPGGQDR